MIICMTIQHLPFFLEVAENEHLTRAAVRVNMTQSALSRRIQAFEAALGISLFERVPGGMRLKPQGQSLRADARRLLDEYERAIHRARQIERGDAGTFRVAFSGIAVRHPKVPRWISAFRAATPGVDLKLLPMDSGRQIDALMAGAIDAAFLYGPIENIYEVDNRAVFAHDFLLALPKDHPLGRRAKLRLVDLKNESFIWNSRTVSLDALTTTTYDQTHSSIYDRIMTNCQLGGLSPKIVVEVSTAEARLNLVEAGMGVCFVDDLQQGRQSTQFILRKVVDFSVPLIVNLAWRRSDQSPMLSNFIQIVSNQEAD
jgi:DNA-binding transcriptional LysR family regulator